MVERRSTIGNCFDLRCTEKFACSPVESEWIRQANKYGNYQNRLDDLYIRWRIPDGASCQKTACRDKAKATGISANFAETNLRLEMIFLERRNRMIFDQRFFHRESVANGTVWLIYIEWNKCLTCEVGVFYAVTMVLEKLVEISASFNSDMICLSLDLVFVVLLCFLETCLHISSVRNLWLRFHRRWAHESSWSNDSFLWAECWFWSKFIILNALERQYARTFTSNWSWRRNWTGFNCLNRTWRCNEYRWSKPIRRSSSRSTFSTGPILLWLGTIR